MQMHYMTSSKSIYSAFMNITPYLIKESVYLNEELCYSVDLIANKYIVWFLFSNLINVFQIQNLISHAWRIGRDETGNPFKIYL
jgi:hypothetical protein